MDRLYLDVLVALHEALARVAAIPADSTAHDTAVAVARDLDAIRARLAAECWEHRPSVAAELRSAEA